MTVESPTTRPAPARADGGSAPRVFPASPAQQRLWFLDRMSPGRPVYNVPAAVRVSGPLDAELLKRSLDALVRRHGALRTTFSCGPDGAPVQVVAPTGECEMLRRDFTRLPRERAERAAVLLANRDARRPVDLVNGPVCRAVLGSIRGDEHLFLFVVHHIVAEGWSIAVLFRELEAIYGALGEGRSPPIHGPPQFAEFIAREAAGGEEPPNESSDYWRRRLAGELPVLELTTDLARPARREFRGAWESAAFPENLARTVKEFSRRSGGTPYMTLLAAYWAVLSRHTGADEIVVGCPVAGRNHPDTIDMVGLFVNTLPLRIDGSGSPTFQGLWARVRDACIEAFVHQDVPFERLVEQVSPERSLNRTPLCQTLFALQNMPRPVFRPAGATSARALGPSVVHNGSAKVDLALFVEEGSEGWTAAFEYDADLFLRSTIRRLLEQFLRLLREALSDPDRRVCDIPMFEADPPPAPQSPSNTSPSGRGRRTCIHEVFRGQAARRRHAPAVQRGSETLTYGDLDRRSDGLAAELRAVGVRPGAVVGVCDERRIETVTALLAVLKAGAAYLPVDPDLPADRLCFILNDSGASVVVAGRGAPRLPEHCPVPVVHPESGEDFRETGAAADAVEPDAPAYIMYTSGSTGAPKGVVVPHRAVVHLVRGADYARLDEAEVLCHAAPLSFDASTFEIWGALLNGAKLVLCPSRVPAVNELAGVLGSSGTTTMWLTAALYNTIVDVHPEALRGLRQLLIGGEALSVPHVLKGLSLLPSTQMINGYGPTEATTFTCCFPISRTLRSDAARVPIGRPIQGAYVRVLDAGGRPVAPGAPGELHIGGEGLALGYWKRPELTADKFIPDPFSSPPGARLYRTGDRVRLLPDGSLDFLGRLDDQIKLRGFRIEPGEIQAALRSHPDIADAAVVPRIRTGSETSLNGYFVPAPGRNPRIADVRDFLRRRLPTYMVPAALVSLDALPLTANGKVDRRALPEPGRTPPDDGERVEPADELERRLAEIWSECLGRTAVGVTDDFFDLGGHSLSAVRLFHRLEVELGVNPPLTALFQAPTVRGLARSVRERLRPRTDSVIPINPAGDRPPFHYVAHAGILSGGYSANMVLLSRRLGRDQPFYTFAVPSCGSRESPAITVEWLADLFVRDLLAHPGRGPHFLGGYCVGGLIAFEMARRLRAAGRKVGGLILAAPSPLGGAASLPFPRCREFFWTAMTARLQEAVWRWYTCAKHRVGGLMRRGGDGSPRRIKALIELAILKYRPSHYPGRVMLLQPAKSGGSRAQRFMHLGWRTAAAEVCVLDVPAERRGFGSHPAVAQALGRCLRECQAAHADVAAGPPQ